MIKVKQILTLFLGLYLLMAMAGFSLYQHICSCSGIVSTSIIAEASCCETASNGEQSCSSHSQTSCSDYGCGDCNCETKIEVYATDYTIANEIKSNTIAKLLKHIVAYSTIKLELPIETELNFTHEFTDNSPPKAGKYLVILHQSLKIPFPIS